MSCIITQTIQKSWIHKYILDIAHAHTQTLSSIIFDPSNCYTCLWEKDELLYSPFSGWSLRSPLHQQQPGRDRRYGCTVSISYCSTYKHTVSIFLLCNNINMPWFRIDKTSTTCGPLWPYRVTWWRLLYYFLGFCILREKTTSMF